MEKLIQIKSGLYSKNFTRRWNLYLIYWHWQVCLNLRRKHKTLIAGFFINWEKFGAATKWHCKASEIPSLNQINTNCTEIFWVGSSLFHQTCLIKVKKVSEDYLFLCLIQYEFTDSKKSSLSWNWFEVTGIKLATTQDQVEEAHHFNTR